MLKIGCNIMPSGTRLIRCALRWVFLSVQFITTWLGQCFWCQRLWTNGWWAVCCCAGWNLRWKSGLILHVVVGVGVFWKLLMLPRWVVSSTTHWFLGNECCISYSAVQHVCCGWMCSHDIFWNAIRWSVCSPQDERCMSDLVLVSSPNATQPRPLVPFTYWLESAVACRILHVGVCKSTPNLFGRRTCSDVKVLLHVLICVGIWTSLAYAYWLETMFVVRYCCISCSAVGV